jgi:hypothetical protein
MSSQSLSLSLPPVLSGQVAHPTESIIPFFIPHAVQRGGV